MKYMGSKRTMLRNGLGHVLLAEAKKHPRFVDLFSGSGAVATFISTRLNIEVLACDLQSYSCVLTNAVIGRTHSIDSSRLWRNWRARARYRLRSAPSLSLTALSEKKVRAARAWSIRQEDFPITKAYGGHYYSPYQSLWIDALRSALPLCEPDRTVALAALIDAASECAASPGHTAQPFQPTESASKHLADSWSRSVPGKTRAALVRLAPQFANVRGNAQVCDANVAALGLQARDLVFIDPPYSALHYSRFYHVLETVSLGYCGNVDGVGRYPPPDERPRSAYSVKSESKGALTQLLEVISNKGADAILTFPNHQCSNGLSGEVIKKIASAYFEVSEKIVRSSLSTLGGVGEDNVESETRGARRQTEELILLLKCKPKKTKSFRGRVL